MGCGGLLRICPENRWSAAGVIENVQGLRGADGEHTGCALQMVVTALRDCGYAVRDLDLDLQSFHQASRPRLAFGRV